jgi:hypothetical protein
MVEVLSSYLGDDLIELKQRVIEKSHNETKDTWE